MAKTVVLSVPSEQGPVCEYYTRKTLFCTVSGGSPLQEFDIRLRSFAQLQKFVSLATLQPFAILVGNTHQQFSAKSFMGIVSLDFSKPIHVWAECSKHDLDGFRQAIRRCLQ